MTALEMAKVLDKSIPHAPVIVEVGGKFYEVRDVTIPSVAGLSVLIRVLETKEVGDAPDNS